MGWHGVVEVPRLGQWNTGTRIAPPMTLADPEKLPDWLRLYMMRRGPVRINLSVWFCVQKCRPRPHQLTLHGEAGTNDHITLQSEWCPLSLQERRVHAPMDPQVEVHILLGICVHDFTVWKSFPGPENPLTWKIKKLYKSTSILQSSALNKSL